eukprot:TRINITY_DN13706_c0_g1_i1.p1 TRINITY_DN13706_c0_g1~~TRINITY_DN13706_c0_g1_i1.p1  ORF type:complete len:1062 (+),score=100.97 TRINITY_DN13706_c0_g1_i1:117-3188(+)
MTLVSLMVFCAVAAWVYLRCSTKVWKWLVGWQEDRDGDIEIDDVTPEGPNGLVGVGELVARGEWGEVWDLVQAEVERRPLSVEGLVWRSKVFMEKGEVNNALDDAVAALAAAPGSYQARVQTAIASTYLGKTVDAYMQYDSALAETPPPPIATHINTLQSELTFTYTALFTHSKSLWKGRCDALIDILDADDESEIADYIKKHPSEVTEILANVSKCLRIDKSLIGPWYLSAWPIFCCDTGTFILSRTIQVMPEFVAGLDCVRSIINGLRDVTQVAWGVHHGIAKYAALGLVMLGCQERVEWVAKKAAGDVFWFVSAWLKDLRSEVKSDEPVTPVCGCYHTIPRHSAVTWIERLIKGSPSPASLAATFLSHPERTSILTRAILVTRDERVSSTAVPLLLSLPGVIEWVAASDIPVGLHVKSPSRMPPLRPLRLPEWVLWTLAYMISCIDDTDHLIFTPLACREARRLVAERPSLMNILTSHPPLMFTLARLASSSQQALALLEVLVGSERGAVLATTLRDKLLTDIDTGTRFTKNIEAPTWEATVFSETQPDFFDLFTEEGTEGTTHPLLEAWNLTEVLQSKGQGGEHGRSILKDLTNKMSALEMRKWLISRRVLRASDDVGVNFWSAEDDETVFIESNRKGDMLPSVIEMMRNKTGLGADNLKGLLEIRFENETSVGSAVAREWADLMASSVYTNASLDILTPAADPAYLTISPIRKYLSPTWELEYQSLGRLLALCIWHQITVDLPLSPFVWDLVLGRGDGEMPEEDHPAMVKYLESSAVEELGVELTFTKMLKKGGTEEEVYFWSGTDVLGEGDGSVVVDAMCYEELVEGGRRVAVDEGNKDEFLRLVKSSEWLRREVAAIREGFSAVFPPKILSDISSHVSGQSMADIASGTPTIDITNWRMHTVTTGYPPSPPTPKPIAFFWQALSTFSQHQLSKILQYATGSKRVPHGGFSQLIGYNGGAHKFTLTNGEPHLLPNSYPTAHACICTLDLPPWKDYEEAEKKLREITELEGFRFDEHE